MENLRKVFTSLITLGLGGCSLFGPGSEWEWNGETNENGTGLSAPALGIDGVIYVRSFYALFAFNPDGTVKWRFDTEDTDDNRSPSIGSDGTIYFTQDGCLCAIDSEGNLEWESEQAFGLASIAKDGTIYCRVSPDTSGINYLSAISPDGSVKWQFEVEGDIDLSSYPAIGSDGTIYIGIKNYDYEADTGRGYLYAVNPDGSEKWRYEGTTSPLAPSYPVIGEDGTAYCLGWSEYYEDLACLQLILMER